MKMLHVILSIDHVACDIVIDHVACESVSCCVIDV